MLIVADRFRDEPSLIRQFCCLMSSANEHAQEPADMTTLLRILHLEDDCNDADLVRETLAAGGIACNATCVATQEEFVAAIAGGSFDLVFADYTLASFDGMSALKIVQQSLPDVPFIFVTRTLGEETAVEALKLGATDYVSKTRLSRLVPSVRRALWEAAERRALKHSADALRAREEQLRTIIDCLEGFVWSANADGEVDFLNQKWTDYSGLSLKSSVGQGWRGTIHPEDADALASYWASLLHSGQSGEYEARIRRFDGVYRWFLMRAVPIRDESGQIAKWYGLNIDIDDRKRNEEALKRSECFLAETRRLSLTGGIWRNAATGKSIWSEEVYSIYEIDPAEPSKVEVLLDKLHPEDRSRVSDAMERSHTLGADFELPHRVLMSDGRLKYIHLVAHLTRNAEGELEYIAAIQDVTERKVAEQALHRLRSELAHVSRVTSLGALTASIAHEVNQPLSGIITNASTCLRMLAASPPNIDGALETARRTIRDGNRASDVIRRLRAMFSKQDAMTESLDLNEATREVIALAMSELQKGNVTVRSELARDLPIIQGDRVQLQQVILNLVLNAAEAMRVITGRPKLLVIRTERVAEDQVRLTVQDTGVGLEPHRVDTLFEAFYTTKPDGMGIGLSVSRSIIERHNGRIWATANDGPGATFSFSVPLVSQSVPGGTMQFEPGTNAVRAMESL